MIPIGTDRILDRGIRAVMVVFGIWFVYIGYSVSLWSCGPVPFFFSRLSWNWYLCYCSKLESTHMTWTWFLGVSMLQAMWSSEVPCRNYHDSTCIVKVISVDSSWPEILQRSKQFQWILWFWKILYKFHDLLCMPRTKGLSGLFFSSCLTSVIGYSAMEFPVRFRELTLCLSE